MIGFVARRADPELLDRVYAATHADRTSWLAYPKPARLGTDIARAVRFYGVEAIQQVSLEGAWSAFSLRPIEQDELAARAADLEVAWPGR